MATTTKYIWDDDNLLAEADGTNAINVVYTNEPKQFGNLVSTRIAGTTSYQHFDALGSTRQLTNSAGTVTDTVIDDAWGNVVNRTGTTGVSLLWIGELGYYSDSETGLIYVRRRPYGPVIARWTTVDPLPTLDGVQLFVYAGNSPAFSFDPSGLFFFQQVLPLAPNDPLAPAAVAVPRCRPIGLIVQRSRCTYFPNINNGAAGVVMKVIASFHEPCDSCRYRQFVKGKIDDRAYLPDQKPGIWEPYLAEIPAYKEDCGSFCYGGRGADRWLDETTGKPTLHGEGTPWDAYLDTGCSYKSFDLAGPYDIKKKSNMFVVEYQLDLYLLHTIEDIVRPNIALSSIESHVKCTFRFLNGMEL